MGLAGLFAINSAPTTAKALNPAISTMPSARLSSCDRRRLSSQM
jgi:hypothetical protein